MGVGQGGGSTWFRCRGPGRGPCSLREHTQLSSDHSVLAKSGGHGDIAEGPGHQDGREQADTRAVAGTEPASIWCHHSQNGVAVEEDQE